MEFSLYTLGGLVLVIGFLAQQLVNYIRVARFKKLHKCEPETQIPQPERIIGYELYKIQLEASKNKKILEVGRQRYINNGNTWSAVMVGRVSSHVQSSRDKEPKY